MRTRDHLDSLFSLQGKRAVVTGGNSGIGRSIAVALGWAGATVHIVARDQPRLDEVLSELTAHGVEVTADSVDLADDRALRSLCETPALQNCDVLVNCAGVNLRPPLAETSDDDYRLNLAVNLEAPYHLGQAAGPRMAQRGWGRIINVGSQQSWSAFGNSGTYGVAKAAVAGLSRVQSEAWARHGVTANTVIPGFVITPMTRATVAEPGRAEALAARTHIGRNGEPSDFAGVAVFLASDAARYVTGQAIAVDGGFSVA